MATTHLQSFQLEHLPAGHDIHVALFKNLQNAEFLQKQLLDGNAAFEYALIDASVIISQLHILSGVYRAVNDLAEERLRSRNVHSEIVFSLSPNNNIASSFRTFGIVPTTKDLLLVKVSTPTSTHMAESVQNHISSVIEGEQVPFTNEHLATMTDWPKVKKIYKLNVTGSGGSKKVPNGVSPAPQGVELKEFEVMILGAMALRGAAS